MMYPDFIHHSDVFSLVKYLIVSRRGKSTDVSVFMDFDGSCLNLKQKKMK